MKLKQTPELHAFLVTAIADVDLESEAQSVRAFAENASPDRLESVISQIQGCLERESLPVEEFGSEANRWFGSDDEARAWFEELLAMLEPVRSEGSAAEPSVAVKDSNGALLSEGDSALVIKDLKVKGASSDLKRGTLVKKIHLVDDPEVIECKVDGSTLVLKTCFLKKA